MNEPFILHREVDRIAERLRDDRPNLYECLRGEPAPVGLADDWRSFIAEVRASPISHALVAIFTIVGWTVLLVLPTLLGAWS